jgi:hypothetical protein
MVGSVGRRLVRRRAFHVMGAMTAATRRQATIKETALPVPAPMSNVEPTQYETVAS